MVYNLTLILSNHVFFSFTGGTFSYGGYGAPGAGPSYYYGAASSRQVES